MNDKTTIVISRARGTDPQRRKLEEDLAATLAARPAAVVLIPHLVDLAADGPGMCYLRSIPGDLIVLGWLHCRAAHWTLHAGGVKGRVGHTSSSANAQPAARDEGRRDTSGQIPERTIWCLDLRQHEQPGPYLEETERIAGTAREASAAAGQPLRLATSGDVNRVEETTRSRWYPVIDFDRCANCLECLDFCLFGVFSLDESGSILVEQPDACRAGCPACSRICPEAAIMFPQHTDPAIAGHPEASLSGLKLDLSQLFGGLNPFEQATAERDRAWQEQRAPGAKPQADTGPPAEKDDLDHLVDELDDLDL